MTNQTSLFSMVKVVAKTKVVDIPSSHGYRSHKNDPSTSRAAEPSPAKLTRQAREALALWKRHSPCTAMQAAARQGGDVLSLYYMLSQRRNDIKEHLQETGRVIDGRKEYRVV